MRIVATREALLEHMGETGGFTPGDPIVVSREQLEELEAEGLVTLDAHGSAALTAKGRALRAWTTR